MRTGNKAFQKAISFMLMLIMVITTFMPTWSYAMDGQQPAEQNPAAMYQEIDDPMQEEQADADRPQLDGAAEENEQQPQPDIGGNQAVTVIEDEPETASDVRNTTPPVIDGVCKISCAEELPATLEAGVTYVLTADINFASGQQIITIAGVLDGKGHTITLNGKPLANNVTGTIRNLGLSGNVKTTDYSAEGVAAIDLNGGAIINCYSTATIAGGKYADVGGFVGTMKNNASIKNSFFAGNATPGQYCTVGGASVYANGTNSISDFYYIKGSITAYTSNSTAKTNCALKTAADFASANMVTLLNNDIEPTGYIWELKTGAAYPTLVAGVVSNKVDKSGLEATIDNAKALDEGAYTIETWAVLKAALLAAEEICAKEDAAKAEVNTATTNLENAINSLEKKKATEPVAKPADESKIVHIKNQSQLEGIGAGDKDKCYVLDNDISLDNWYMHFGEFNGVFDGNGHTVKYNTSYTSLFEKLGTNGVVQNVHFTGSLRAAADYGAVAREVKGSVVNCYSEISGDKASGIAKRLAGGMISNCYSVSTAGNGVVLGSADAAYTGTLKNVYWLEGLKQTADLSKLTTDNAVELRFPAMTSLGLVDALNQNKGQYGVSWGQNSNGYPYFGENQDYVPGQVELPENEGVELSFTMKDGSFVKVENQEISIDKNKANETGYVGKFNLVGFDVPEGAEVVWRCEQQTPEGTADIVKKNSMYAEDAGEFFAYKEGTVVVTATLEKADGTKTVLAATKVNTYVAEIEAIKLYVADFDGKNPIAPTDGKVSVQGAADKKVIVEAKYKDSNVYQRVESPSFYFTVDAEEGLVKHTENSSTFRFNEPGTATITVTHKNIKDITASVEVTSEYVQVKSVAPGIAGTYKLHSRDGNGSNSAPFVTIYANPAIVTPDYASYKGDYTVTSSDPEIAEYIKSMANGFVPYKAGTVTFTTTLNDNGREVSGSSEVVFEYLNPLKNVSVEKTEITMKNGEVVPAGLSFEGTDDSLTHVSETGMLWTYDKEGVVTVVREGGAWYNDGTPENTGYFLSDEYNIKALSEGTVTITGTPVDDTAGAQPVTIKVTVEKSDIPVADIDKIISEGIAVSTNYLSGRLATDPAYGNEWNIMSLLRADKAVDQGTLDKYYASVAEEIKAWDGTEKPTDIERVTLALAAMGKDITDVEGVNLAEMIYNSGKLDTGSNELAFALLALDALDTEIPETAKWSRDEIVAELLTFQNEEGFFGLSDNRTASIDMTAMSLQALAPYRGKQVVDEAIAKGLEYLKSEISDNYDYGDSNATAQVLLTLAVLDVDVTDPTNGFGTAYDNIITRLEDYRTADGFAYTIGGKTNAMATYQVMQSLDAYRKAQNDGVSYWDFNENSDEKYDDSVDESENNGDSKEENKPQQSEDKKKNKSTTKSANVKLKKSGKANADSDDGDILVQTNPSIGDTLEDKPVIWPWIAVAAAAIAALIIIAVIRRRK